MIKKRSAVIFDLDGTLCDDRHRIKYLTDESIDKKERYNEYHRRCIEDLPIPQCLERIHALGDSQDLFFVTGRTDTFMNITLKWLNLYVHRKYYLSMRPVYDLRHASAFKKERFSCIKDNYSKIEAVYDDHPPVLDVAVEMGIKEIYHCDYGKIQEYKKENPLTIHDD